MDIKDIVKSDAHFRNKEIVCKLFMIDFVKNINKYLDICLRQIRIIRVLCIIFTIISFVPGCCSFTEKDFEFNESELAYFSSFVKGDTLLFENTKGEVDTIKIHDIAQEKYDQCGFLASRPSNTISIEIEHLPANRWNSITITKYTDGRVEKSKNYQSLFQLTKYPLEENIEFHISFREFQSRYGSIFETKHKYLILNGFKWTNVYSIEHGYPERIKDSTDLEVIYWSKKKGLIGYKNKIGELWTRVPPPPGARI